MSEEFRTRYMRILVMFDLPVETAVQRRNYRLFRKNLIKDGYLMLQKSVYVKLAVNEHALERELQRLRKKKPPEGLVQVLKITEKQFATMEYITGKRSDFDEIDTTEEFVII